MLIDKLLSNIDAVLVWSLVATALMTIILQGSQSLGYSRLSLPFLFGTFVTGNRGWAVFLGYVVYTIGGSLFAFLYCLIFASLGYARWWLGAIVGALHGLFLLVSLAVAPQLHPRIASPYDPPTAGRKLEPPGFFGLNYGRRTPITTLTGQLVYGGVLGAFLPVN
jgi:hypothetical protein